MRSRRTNNFHESGRGLGHVTGTIFGSTVGYPSDSFASCFTGSLSFQNHFSISFSCSKTKNNNFSFSFYVRQHTRYML